MDEITTIEYDKSSIRYFGVAQGSVHVSLICNQCLVCCQHHQLGHIVPSRKQPENYICSKLNLCKTVKYKYSRVI